MNQNKYLQINFLFILFFTCYIYNSHQMVLVSEPTDIIKGNYLSTLTIPKVYEISFEVYLTSVSTTPTNLIHFTTGNNCCGYGTRIASVFVSSQSTLAEFTAPVNGNGNYHFFAKLPLMKWTKITSKQYLSHGMYFYAVEIDGQTVHIVQNNDTRIFENVKLYISNVWFNATKGFIRNLAVPMLETNSNSFTRDVMSEATIAMSDVIKVPLTVIFGADAIVTYIDPSDEASDADTCIFTCLQNAKCFSLSYSQTGRVCMIYDVNIRTNQNSFGSNINWDTYVL
ncbi:uncharacterized protein LOC124815450 isoform X1 [Hydra vulgaris]|uniref:uncharacterized protein LOC124815450 isoform X1 n=1 Tax=Hydra vulgaris TaxID=6087 RepID=UPI001F5F51C3|nr:uncharacterized protein LOC124815450 [Hydra vulgaris]